MAESSDSAAPARQDDWADRIVIVLVEPQHPGNVGAAARAMANMGLHRLVLVRPAAYDPEQARWMAPGADDVLDAARIVATTDEALVGVNRAIATTARHRRSTHLVHTPDDLAAGLVSSDLTTAILFGREDQGLANEDVLRCESLIRIPTPEHASLNLAQAVLLVSHRLFEAARAAGAPASGRRLGGTRAKEAWTSRVSSADKRDRPAGIELIEPAVTELVSLLDRVGYLRAMNAEKPALLARQALQRSGVSIRHVEALRGMIARVRSALDPERNPREPREQREE